MRVSAAWVAFGMACVLPAVAVFRLTQRYPAALVLGYALIISLAAAIAVWLDKAKARAGAWRIPEATLHALELAGGWPGAFIAQRRARHKTAKTSYQLIYWAIVGIHQAIAYAII